MPDCEDTIKLFAEQYYEKIFYFSLKKTGNQTEAEDLTSDIAMDIITALRKGIIPDHFSAYVWKSAHNRFSKWVENKYKHRKYFDNGDISYHISSEKNLESDYILKEDINSMRREIALISKDYREILVSFYIDDKKISQIAKEVNLPEGTVKTKLFKSRKILMEGMKMAREFGVKSYKPENVSYVKSGGDGTDGSPWSKIRTKLAKNILLETYYNASTIEELALELGVAAPYMEEAVAELADAELLKKSDKNKKDKYETNFMIFSADIQRDIENIYLNVKDEYFTLAKDILNIVEKDGEKNLLGGTQTFEELKWLYLLKVLTDEINWEVIGAKFPDSGTYTKRPYNGQWDLMGYEDYVKDGHNGFIGNNGGSYDFNKISIWSFDFHSFSWGKRPTNWSFNSGQVKTAEQILDGKTDEADKKIIEELVNLGAFEVKDGKYICKMAICKGDKDLLRQSVSENIYNNKIKPLYDKIVNLHSKLYDDMIEIVKKAIPERFHDKLWFALETVNMRSFLIVTAINDGYITIPKDFSKSMVGIVVYKK